MIIQQKNKNKKSMIKRLPNAKCKQAIPLMVLTKSGMAKVVGTCPYSTHVK